MSDTTGNEYDETQTSLNDSSSMFSDSRSLHERLSEHLENCSECQKGIKSLRPLGIGQRSHLCSKYQDIIAVWAEQEGAANNIVDHDEFGNSASPHYWELQSWQ